MTRVQTVQTVQTVLMHDDGPADLSPSEKLTQTKEERDSNSETDQTSSSARTCSPYGGEIMSSGIL